MSVWDKTTDFTEIIQFSLVLTGTVAAQLGLAIRCPDDGRIFSALGPNCCLRTGWAVTARATPSTEKCHPSRRAVFLPRCWPACGCWIPTENETIYDLSMVKHNKLKHLDGLEQGPPTARGPWLPRAQGPGRLGRGILPCILHSDPLKTGQVSYTPLWSTSAVLQQSPILQASAEPHVLMSLLVTKMYSSTHHNKQQTINAPKPTLDKQQCPYQRRSLFALHELVYRNHKITQLQHSLVVGYALA